MRTSEGSCGNQSFSWRARWSSRKIKYYWKAFDHFSRERFQIQRKKEEELLRSIRQLKKKRELNRKKDFLDGSDKHLITSNLDLAKELDIKRLKKIRSYRGLRHATGRPTRGQRTRSNFRKNRKKGVGIKKKSRE